MKVAFVSPFDIGGGAENVAWNIFSGLKKKGVTTWMLVREKRSKSPDIFLLENDRYRNRWARIWVRIGDVLKPLEGKVRGAIRLRKAIHLIGQPERRSAINRGFEDFDFPGTYHIFNFLPDKPDIIHCHNLHGYYFDLRALPWLSKKVPVVLTLHDVWLMTGHCSCFFSCEKWKTGCGECPDLNFPPAIKKDATDKNWLRKKEIYKRSILYVVTPSKWLMNIVQQSILAKGIALNRTIPNGIDTDIFSPGDRVEARTHLGLPLQAFIILFVTTTTNRIEKGFAILEKALHILSQHHFPRELSVLVLGTKGRNKKIGSISITYVPFQKEKEKVAEYYRASDLFVHPALQDNFPNTVLEALSCGTPVVASRVGGIPEQIIHEKTGMLVPPGDAESLAQTLSTLITHHHQLKTMGEEARKYILDHYTLEHQVESYLTFYEEVIKDWKQRILTTHSLADTDGNGGK